MSSQEPQPEPAKHHGTLHNPPPTPHEELGNLGLVQEEAAAHTSHHPDHDNAHEAKPTSAHAPTIHRPVA